jgi:DNA-binding transcriptional regulator YhcF (GntR family)
MASAPRLSSQTTKLEEYLRELVTKDAWPLEKPLPTTRSLGKKFGVANTTASRALSRLESENLVWKRDNGRYHLESSRHLFHRPEPVACLTRELERWSALYQAIMAGVSAYTAERQTALLLWRNESLIEHNDVSIPPRFGSLQQQISSLGGFVRSYGKQLGGILIDDAWTDEALSRFPGLLENAVVLYRKTELPQVGNVCIDTEASALLALSHLLARGYGEIWIARPFPGHVATDFLIATFASTAKQVGAGGLPCRLKNACTPAEREALAGEASSASNRIGIFCPEDNISHRLYVELRAQGADCPGKIGLMSGMGTTALRDESITSLSFDFRRMGALAAAMVCARKTEQIKMRPELMVRETT